MNNFVRCPTRSSLLWSVLLSGVVFQAVSQKDVVRTSKKAPIVRQAQTLYAQHKLQAAIDALVPYVANHEADVPALTLLAAIQHGLGKDAEALQLLEEALRAEPQSYEANLAAGKILLSQQRYPEAMDRFETILSNTPHSEAARALELDAVTKLATSAAQAGNPDAALSALEHARTKMPDNSRLLIEVGLQALDLRLYAQSNEALQAARRIASSNPDVTYALARLELEQQHMPLAESYLRSYLAARPNDASAHFGLGRVLAMQQHDDAARVEFERSVKLQPMQTESYYQIGQLDLNAHRSDDAKPLFQRVIDRDPNHGGALVGLGQIAFQERDYDQAEGYLRRAVTSAPEYGPAHYYLGLTLARLGKKSEADQELQTATKLGKVAAAPVQSGQNSSTPQ